MRLLISSPAAWLLLTVLSASPVALCAPQQPGEVQSITTGNIGAYAEVVIQQIQKIDPDLAQAVKKLSRDYEKQTQIAATQARTLDTHARIIENQQGQLKDKEQQIAELQKKLADGALRLAQQGQAHPNDAEIQAARTAYLKGDTRLAEALFKRNEAKLVQQARQRQQEADAMLANADAMLANAADMARERVAMAQGRDSLAVLAAWADIVSYQPDNTLNWWKYGDAAVAAGNLPLALEAYSEFNRLAKKRTAQDPANTEWQRDVSVSLHKVGDIQQKQGKLDAALENYQAGLTIAKKLSDQDPANTEWQRDVSVSLEKVGDIQQTQGKLDAALANYQASLKIAKKLSDQDPANVEWQMDLVVSYVKTASCAPAVLTQADGVRYLQQALAIAQRLQQAGMLPYDRQPWPEEIAKRLAALEQ